MKLENNTNTDSICACPVKAAPACATKLRAGRLAAQPSLAVLLGITISGLAFAQRIAEPRRYTVKPGISTEITLKTIPDAECILHRENESDPEHQLRVHSDPDGLIRFHALPSGESNAAAVAMVDCAAGGAVARFPLQLRSHSEATAEMPSPQKALAATPGRGGARFRPNLMPDEAGRLSDEELVSRGYPIRPDPDEAPGAYNAWRRAVSAPATFIEPHVVAHPRIGHSKAVAYSGAPANDRPSNGLKSFLNWSGFGLEGIFGSYDWVTGTWIVPRVTSETNQHTYSAYWIGLDGDGPVDLVQDGTEQEITNIDFGFIRYTFSTYYAWTEFLPQQQTEMQITNFAIHPGDEIFSEVWIGNAGGSPSLTGYFGVFFIESLTTSTYTYIYTPRGATAIDGSEAVWVMERPTVNNAYPYLANYGSATMFNAYARRANGTKGYVPYQGDRNAQFTMVNGSGKALSTVTAVDAYSMRFNWQASH